MEGFIKFVLLSHDLLFVGYILESNDFVALTTHSHLIDKILHYTKFILDHEGFYMCTDFELIELAGLWADVLLTANWLVDN